MSEPLWYPDGNPPTYDQARALWLETKRLNGELDAMVKVYRETNEERRIQEVRWTETQAVTGRRIAYLLQHLDELEGELPDVRIPAEDLPKWVPTVRQVVHVLRRLKAEEAATEAR